MNNAIVEQKSFQERMKERIKDSIGELMTDKELSEIVHRAMEEIFFKPISLKDGFHTKEEPPFVHKLIKDLLVDEVRSAVTKYITDNKKDVIKIIRQVIELGMGNALLNAIKYQFDNDLMNFQGTLLANIQNR